MRNLQAALNDLATGQSVASNYFNQHLLIVGQTGSGKTTTARAILSQLQNEDQTAIVLDPTGEYRQLPNAVCYQLGTNAYLEAGKLTAAEFQEVLGVDLPASLQRRLAMAVDSLKVQKNLCHAKGVYRKINRPISAYQEQLEQLRAWTSTYHLTDLPAQLVEETIVPYPDERADYSLLGQQYDRAQINQDWAFLATFDSQLAGPAFRQLFDTVPHPGISKTELGFVLQMFLNHRSSHRTLVIDLSILKKFERQQGAIISYLLKQILNYRLASPKSVQPCKIVIDEAHRYLPTTDEALNHNGIFQVLREGRKVNLQLALTTQSPLDLPERLRSQFSSVIIHRLLDQQELECLATPVSFRAVAGLTTGNAILQRRGEAPEKVWVVSQ